MINSFLTAFILPPGLFFSLSLLALFLLKSYPKVSRSLICISLLSLYLLSAPFFSQKMVNFVESQPDNVNESLHYDGVVCLTGGINFNSPEYPKKVSPSSSTITRCSYAARLARKLSLPLLISGRGIWEISEADLLSKYLNDLGLTIPIRIENSSHNTHESPIAIQRKFGSIYKNIILVTDAAHMFRAKRIFLDFGFNVTAMPTNYSEFEQSSILSFVPNIRALEASRRSLHEIVGLVYYVLATSSTK